MIRSIRRLAAISTALIALLPTPAVAARPDADEFEVFFPSVDGSTRLRALVLRPKGLSMKVRTPVIMTVSPYLNRNELIDPQETGTGRFDDFLNLSDVLRRRYTYVMVDLPGFGGSGGCNDWGGVREQDAVEAAVEWAARQPWSTGKVGLLGKSYDGWTGLMGVARRPKGLAAVLAMEPVYAGYRYLYTNGVRLPASLSTPVIFQLLDAQPGDANASADYQVNSPPLAWCYGVNIALQQQDDANVGFWQERDLLPKLRGARTPVFLTQGLLERNTKPDGAFDVFNGLRGPKRAWFGQFDHVRGWQDDGNGYETGRSTFIREAVRFFDRHLKGANVTGDPTVIVQDNYGRYRAERRWPPVDMRMVWNVLNNGSYVDDGANTGTGSTGGNGVWTFSQRLRRDVWMAGEPVVRVDVETPLPRGNLVVNVYDVAPNGEATLVSRGAHLLRNAGRERASVVLYGQDWVFTKGHRIGVLVSAANREWWTHVPTRTTVGVRHVRLGMPLLAQRRRAFIDGEMTPRLENHLDSAFVTVSNATIGAAERRFHLD